MLEIEGLCAGYGKVAILHDITLRVARGECVALLGPNNAGKSTLLRTISGLLRARAGRIVVNGEDIAHLSSGQIVSRGIVQIPEGRHVFKDLSVEDNLLVGASRLAHAARRKAIADIYQRYPLFLELRGRRAGNLSGGQQQSVAIARALVAQPILLLIDEPTLGLSPVAIDDVFTMLDSLKHSGATIFLSEQNAELSLELCSRGYVLSKGEIVLEGDAAALREAALHDFYMA